MKTKQILMTGALALSMVLSGGMLTGCSNSINDNLNMYINDHLRMYTSDYALI